MFRLLDKNPATRLDWAGLRAHPFWKRPLPELALPPETALQAYIQSRELGSGPDKVGAGGCQSAARNAASEAVFAILGGRTRLPVPTAHTSAVLLIGKCCRQSLPRLRSTRSTLLHDAGCLLTECV